MLFTFTTACGQAPTLAEVEQLSQGTAESVPAEELDPTLDVTPPKKIDSKPHAEATFNTAVATCKREGRNLCTVDQYNIDGLRDGQLNVYYGHIGVYWMPKTNVSHTQGIVAYRNIYQIGHSGIPSYLLFDTDHLQEYYCCL